MLDGDRPDVRELRKKLTILVCVIAIALITLLATTFILYAKYSHGVRVTP